MEGIAVEMLALRREIDGMVLEKKEKENENAKAVAQEFFKFKMRIGAKEEERALERDRVFYADFVVIQKQVSK